MIRPREQDTVTAILRLLHVHQIVAWRMNTGATKIGGRFLRFGVTGMSDIIGILDWDSPGLGIGRFLAIEVKSAIGKVTPAQQDFLDQITKHGGKAFVARSVDDVQRELFPEVTL